MINKKNIAAIILAAGRGKRMKSENINKVTFTLGGKPMITLTVKLLRDLGINIIITVVGYAKESVKEVLGDSVKYAVQEEQLGTADAVNYGLKQLPEATENVIVMNGDDSAFFKSDTIEMLIQEHFKNNSAVTFLTTEKDNPEGIGRIVRSENYKLIKIVEEKDASDKEKKIREINVGCYIFKVYFLKKYIPMLKKSSVTGEYYITGLIDLGIRNGEIIEAIKSSELKWQSINTPEELIKAENLMLKN